MKQLAVFIQPFVQNQTIEYYVDNKKQETHMTSLTDLDGVLASFCETDNIEQIDMYGSAVFAKRIKEKIISKYNCNKTKIIIH